MNENEIQDSGYGEMTPNMYYDACMFIYQFLGYNVEQMSPKEAYLKYADGRDCGLTKLEGDSAESFREWYGIHGFGDHAEDISSCGIMFRVVQLNSGDFAFCLNRVNHTDKDMIHVLLAMIKAGFILAVSNYSQMRDYYTGKCSIGIEPYDGEFDYMREYAGKNRRLKGKFRRLPIYATQELKDVVEWLEPRICELNICAKCGKLLVASREIE